MKDKVALLRKGNTRRPATATVHKFLFFLQGSAFCFNAFRKSIVEAVDLSLRP